MADEFHFEGVEKLLEIWFTKSNNKCTDKNDLRNIPRETIDCILDLVNCKILSSTSTRELDAYVLSESSLFVNKQRLLLKTCGTTTLLEAVQPIIEAAHKFCDFDAIEDVFYSRKKFMRPDLQKAPHQNFEDEVEYLQEVFNGGAAYALGRLNSECWYLYTLSKSSSIKEADQTLEIIMTKLDPKVMDVFTKEACISGEECSKKSGIDKIFPNAILDAYLFDPCGYSVNAILPKGHYFTIHITPEPNCSYVSFETDAETNDYPELIRKVLALFKPEEFIFTFFANETSVGKDFDKKTYNFKEFAYDTYQETKVKNYNVTYAHYLKKPI
jgi:S-adenosylmethionine decarboxylase